MVTGEELLFFLTGPVVFVAAVFSFLLGEDWSPWLQLGVHFMFHYGFNNIIVIIVFLHTEAKMLVFKIIILCTLLTYFFFLAW